MTGRNHSSPITNKETMKNQGSDGKTQTSAASAAGAKTLVNAAKGVKSTGKEMPTSPGAPPENPELLGSVTTTLQQRTSARVIKKLRLDDAAADRDKKEIPECDSQKLKEEEKESLKLTVKQRMPKALWSADEKNLFFEALNEFGKDFDAITAYICAKMKKKGVCDVRNLKTKSQVSHFYYRTWNKLSKYVHFDENVKKVAQELYALINYGELRKKLCSVEEKNCSRLSELVCAGSLVVRSRGKNVRVRTPVCRALRTLNQISGRGLASTPARVAVCLRARWAAAWCRVQGAAHNPRLLAALPPHTAVRALLRALAARWAPRTNEKRQEKKSPCEVVTEEVKISDIEDVPERESGKCETETDVDLECHLNLATERVLLKEYKLAKKPVLHVGPSPTAAIHHPVLTASEHLSSHKICYASYLERVKDRTGEIPKIRTPKRHRKDSTTDKETTEQKKFKSDSDAAENKMVDIEETAIDGIELMASYKNNLEEEINPSTEDEKDIKMEVDDGEDRDRYMSEKEKDSFSEMEDDVCNKSESDNESDHGKDKDGDGEGKVKKLKVKFRIRPRKRGGSVYTLITDQLKDTSPEHQTTVENARTLDEQNKVLDIEQSKSTEDLKQCDNSAKVAEDKKNNTDQIKSNDDQTKTQVDTSKNTSDTNKLTPTTTDCPKVSIDQSKVTPDLTKSPTDQVKSSPELIKDDPKSSEDVDKNDIDIEFVTKQIRKGWSTTDVGDLTIGDLYLMFGARSQLVLDYWWAIPTPPLSPPHKSVLDKPISLDTRASETEKPCLEKKVEKTPEKGTDSSLEDDKEKSDTDIFSPKNVFGQDSNDGLSGDERKGDQIPDAKSSSGKTTFRLASKLVNRPEPVSETQNHLAIMSERLKRLLALAGNPTVPSVALNNGAKCTCGHVCGKKKNEAQPVLPGATLLETPEAPVFRHPAPIAPKPNEHEVNKLQLEGLPRWRRGRGGGRAGAGSIGSGGGAEGGASAGGGAELAGDKRVVVQRLLPLLPKLMPRNDLIPVKLVSNSPPQLPKLAPKPPTLPPSTDTTQVYVVSQCNGQFYFHDGDRKVRLDFQPESSKDPEQSKADVKAEVTSQQPSQSGTDVPEQGQNKPDSNGDISSFLPMSTGSMSPSRLLEGGAWLDAELSLSSLSSLLHHLEPRHELNVDSQLQSLMAESSVDYVRKFADLAAEVADNDNEPHT